MTPEEVPTELVELADLALAEVCMHSGEDRCVCPTDEHIRLILSVTIPYATPILIAGAIPPLAEWLRTEENNPKAADSLDALTSFLLRTLREQE